jgi:aminopeptidase C
MIVIFSLKSIVKMQFTYQQHKTQRGSYNNSIMTRANLLVSNSLAEYPYNS